MRDGLRRWIVGRAAQSIRLWGAVGIAAFATLAAPSLARAAAETTSLRASLTAISDREGARDTTGLSVFLLEDDSPKVRTAAAVALGRIQNVGTVPGLSLALKDRVASVRKESAFA